MALTRPRLFKGQVRGVSHLGQETHLHKQAGYIDADFLHPQLFPCSQAADHTFGKFGYAPKGQTPVLRINSRREGLSVISTVTNKGEMRWKIFSGALNAKVLMDFLKRLTRKASRKLFLILDNLRVHHSKPVKQWLAENAGKIEVFYLPSYSPELNPDELLNADLKQRVTTAAPARTKRALTRTAVGALRSIQKQPQRVQSYFEQKDVSYAAA